MSTSIYRVEYHSIPSISGEDAAEFLEKFFTQNEISGHIYISEEKIAEIENSDLRLGLLSVAGREMLSELKRAVKKHGDFDLSIL